MKCNSDYHAEICPARRRNGDCVSEYPCRHKVEPPKQKTNADHIRSMTDEELAALLDAFCETSECRTGDGAVCPFFSDCAPDHAECDWKVWLKQPYKEEST